MASPVPIVSPESRVTGPTGKSAAPIPAPVRATTSGATITNTAAPAYLTISRRIRPAGATSRYRRVPCPASPAIVSPATTPTVRGRNSGTETTMAVTPTNRPFWAIRCRKAGPRPAGTAEETRTATAIRIGMAASAHNMAHVLRRRNSTPSSDASRPPVSDPRRTGTAPAPPSPPEPAPAPAPLRPSAAPLRPGAGATEGPAAGSPKDELLLDNVEPLPRQCHKPVLKAGLFGREAADPDPRRHEGRHHGFRLHGRPLHGPG